MDRSPIARLSSATLGLGGIAGAAFVIISRGEIMGAMAMVSQRWMIAHNLHFISGALLLYGVVGLYNAQSSRLGVGGHFAFVFALLGTGLYLAGGVITAALLPFIAAVAPTVVAANGPLFQPLLPVVPVSLGLFSLGWFMLGVVTARAKVFPAYMGWLVALGALVQAIPPRPFGPVPWIVADIGWVIFAIGLVGIAAVGWMEFSPTTWQGEAVLTGLASGD